MARREVEVVFRVDRDFLEELKTRLGTKSVVEVMRHAYTLLDWATNEVKNDRLILSVRPDGDDVHRLVMPELEAIRSGMR